MQTLEQWINAYSPKQLYTNKNHLFPLQLYQFWVKPHVKTTFFGRQLTPACNQRRDAGSFRETCRGGTSNPKKDGRPFYGKSWVDVVHVYYQYICTNV